VGQASTIGLDIAKRVFQAHGADASGHAVFRKRLVRAKLLAFFAAQPPCVVAMEACALRASHICGMKCHVPALEEGVETAETPGDGFRAGWLVAA